MPQSDHSFKKSRLPSFLRTCLFMATSSTSNHRHRLFQAVGHGFEYVTDRLARAEGNLTIGLCIRVKTHQTLNIIKKINI